MGLEELREEIRKKDEEIVRLIAERTAVAVRIGEEKKRAGLQVRDVKVEERVKARYAAMGSEKGLSAEVMDRVSSALIKEAVDAESMVPVARRSGKAVVIGGAGKMGAWTAKFLEGSGFEVSVVDPRSGSGLSIDDCAGSDVVVVSVPIHSTGEVLKGLERVCSPETLIFDLTSLKSPIEARLRRMASSMKVCSVHPMFGPSATSLYGRNVIVCDCGNRQAVDEAVGIFDDRGGSIRVMGLSEHDSYMSYVLGLTHAVNIALFTVLERSGFSFEDLRTVSSTTFNKGLDTNMSVASEDPMLYYEIQHLNSHRDEMWDLFSEAVAELREKSLSDDPEGFIALMDAGREYFKH
ncbi:MAG: prephenate dehydrogenase/arogenate dehydrogenase family protein [Candidatus Methanomethylophilaceae archaeon]|nr:prephenate dehydrogenase/arogenate dehydrogenase family protein [Candidatus Methanomethylophilaceae archaeon]